MTDRLATRLHPFSRIMILTITLVFGVVDGPIWVRTASAQADPPDARAADVEAAFVKGYATALLEQTHGLQGFTLRFEPPALEVRFAELPDMALDKLTRSLLELRGVERVRILVADEVAFEESRADGGDPGTTGGRAGIRRRKSTPPIRDTRSFPAPRCSNR